MSKTTDVFPLNRPGWYRVYYIITQSQDVETALTKANCPVVLMFSASWNEPSKVMLAPFRAIADAKRHQAVFCRVDVDKFKDLAERYRVEAFPTFVLFKDGNEQRRVVGPKVDELNKIIN